MLAEQAALIVSLSLKDGITKGIAGIQGKLRGFTVDTAKLHSGLTKISKGLETGIKRGAAIAGSAIALLTVNVKKGIDALIAMQLADAQTNAVIKSTGGVAGVTATAVHDLALKYEELTGKSKESQQTAENLLLTFQNVKSDAFEPALLAANNISTALGVDLTAAAKTVGRALDDPASGLTRLTRLGVTFTAADKETIKTMLAHNDAAGAQSLILQKLTDKFGGSAAAAAQTYQGQMDGINNAVRDLRISLAEALLPALTSIATKMKTFLSSDAAKNGIKQLGDALANLFSNKNIDQAGAALKDVFGYLKGLPWDTISAGLEISGKAAKMAVDAFKSLPPGVQGSLITLLAANKLTGGLVASGLADIGSVILKSLTTINAANVTVIGANVSGGGGVPGVPGVPGKGPGVGGILGLGALLLLLQGSQGDPSSVQGDRPVVPGHAVDDNGYLSNDPRSPLYRILETDQRATALLKAIGDEQDPGTQLRLLQDAGLATNDMTAKVNLGVKNVGDLVKGSTAAQIHASRLDSVNLSERLAQHIDAAKNKASNDAVTTREHNMRDAAAALAEQRLNKQQNRDLSVREQYRMERVKDAIRGTTEALRHKKLSVTVNTSTKVNISAREVLSQQTSFRRWGGVTLD